MKRIRNRYRIVLVNGNLTMLKEVMTKSPYKTIIWEKNWFKSIFYVGWDNRGCRHLDTLVLKFLTITLFSIYGRQKSRISICHWHKFFASTICTPVTTYHLLTLSSLQSFSHLTPFASPLLANFNANLLVICTNSFKYKSHYCTDGVTISSQRAKTEAKLKNFISIENIITDTYCNLSRS